jgi:FkbM family methyltransferase
VDRLVLVNASALRLGGGGTYIVEQLAALSRIEGVEVTAVATGEVARRLHEACGPGTRVIAWPERPLPLRLLREQLALPLRALGHDVVYQAGGFALFASPRPQVVTNQNPHHFSSSARAFWRGRYRPGYRWQLELEWRLAHLSVRRADVFVTVSEAFRRAVEADVGPQPSLVTLPSPAPVLPPPVASTGLEGDAPYALSVANDYPHKDWDGLIGAFLAHPELPRLVIAGDWRDDGRRAELRRRLAGTGRVHVLGPVRDRARLAALYRDASCYVAHSYLEAGPLTPGEARACGLPIAATDIPPHREACGASGVYYEPGDAAALAGAVRAALARGRDARPRHDGHGWTWSENAARLAGLMRAIAPPSFTLGDGGVLPRRLRGLRAVGARGPVMRRLTTSGSSGQRVLSSLPTMTAHYADGRVFRIPAGNRTYGRVFFLDEHEPGTSSVVRRVTEPGDFLIDVGANQGWFSLLMASCAGGDGEVWAIEPLPPAVASLRENLALNPALDVKVLEVAAGAEPGTATINLFEGLPEVHASGSTLGRDDYEPHAVRRETLDGLLASATREPSLVKVDVEGGELEVLRGAERLLDAERPPIWILEVNRVTAGAYGYAPQDLLATLRGRRPHDVYRIGRRGRLEPERDPARAPDGTNWLCVPPERVGRLDDRLPAP